ncbi:hypothetical protein BZA70DRAFT_278351 [Myxozyma melibiosi]|uniref:Pentacotripeptide-repeat region of PRORP domain-containing protein n=1 Tax=Myxozyma melibiosi TaxID=54550 RepID=A0ABR1F6R8_9ASCO
MGNRGGARGSQSGGRALWAIYGEGQSEETERTGRNRDDRRGKDNQKSGRRTGGKSVQRKDEQDEVPVLNNYHRPDRGTKFPEEISSFRDMDMDQDDENVKAKAGKIRDQVFAYASSRPTVRPTVRPTAKTPERQSLKAEGDIDEVELELDMDSDTGVRNRKKNTKKDEPKKKLKDESKKFFKDGPRTRDGAEVTDPYLISKYIKVAIARGNLDVALENARRGGEHSTTGWNLIIQHTMSEAKVNTALSYFNEMRRRGAKPNGYTFTALFQGLANHSAIAPTAVDKTKRILAYAVHKGTFKLEPVLLNAALQVARVNRDIDAMYEILGTAMDVIPLDAASYSIIFNIYSNAGRSNRELGSEVREIWAEAVSEAKRSQRLSNDRVVLFNSVIYNVTRALLKSKSQADVYLAYRIIVNAYNLPQYIVPTELLVSNIIQDPSAVEDTALEPYLCNDTSDESRLSKAPIEKTAVPFIFEACDRLRQRDAFIEYHTYFKQRIYLGSSLHMKYTEQMDKNGLPAVGDDVVQDTVPEVTRKDRRMQRRLYAHENKGKKLIAQEDDEDDD